MKKRILLTLSLLAAFLPLRAQNVIDLIISEALAQPDSTGIVDGYGRRGGWIELFNTSQGTVNFGGCFLSDDRNALRKSIIPKGDARTVVGPRQAVLLYASGKGSDGPMYTDFRVRAGSTLYLTSNDGRTIIDSLVVPANLPAGKSVSKLAHDIKEMDFRTEAQFTEPSPGIRNGDQNAETKSQKMAREDPHGWILSLVSILVVFCALTILWFLFNLLFDRPARKKLSAPKKKGAPADGDVAAAIAMALDLEQGGDDYAAIAMALHLYLTECVHDNESYVLTIRRDGQSGWKSRSGLMRKWPEKK